VGFLLERGQSTFKDIVNFIDRAPSTISWHLSKLENAELITNDHHGITINDMTQKDPVCNMMVDEKKAQHISEANGLKI
jgi:DeoR/GlpR family transcriptional regulator of sugar metabolism